MHDLTCIYLIQKPVNRVYIFYTRMNNKSNYTENRVLLFTKFLRDCTFKI